MELEAYLSSKGYQAKPGPGPERKYPCFFPSGTKLGHGLAAGCGEAADSRKRKLYVNVDDGWFDCKVCGAHGGLTLLQRFFGDEEATELPGASPAERRRILGEATALGTQWLWQDDDTLLYLLNERGLSPETIQERRFGRVRGRWSLTGHIECDRRDLEATGLVYRDGPRAGRDFFTDHILIPYIVHGQVVQIRGKIPGGKYMTGPGEGVRLYNTDSLDEADDVILTEGEFDCAALAQHLGGAADDAVRRIGVVGLAGTGAYPANMESYFSSARRVFVGLDPDDAGRRAAVRVKESLGSRARILELPPELPKCDWTEYLLPIPPDADEWRGRHPHAGHTWQDVLALMGEASGKRLYSIVEAGRRWRTQRTSDGGVKTGWPQLDSILLPGFLPGQLVVLLAKTGTGKGSPLSTDVPTPQGWRQWGHLKIGDEVFGSDGRPTRVTGVYDRGVLPTYRVGFSDGSSLEVDGEHIWTVHYRYGKERRWIGRCDLTTEQLLEEGLRCGNANREWRWCIPLTEPLDYEKADLPMPPYAFGALIANGYLGGCSTEFCSPDSDVVRRVDQEIGLSPRKCSPIHYGVPGWVKTIRGLGLNVRSGEKFIPLAYLTASVEQRIDLLHGLMDGDGSRRKGRKQSLYHTTSAMLARDVVELVTSLGGTATQREARRKGYVEYTVGVMLPFDPFWSQRKGGRNAADTYATEPKRAIVSIERVEDQPIRCISVAARDQLYVVGRQHVVTHNTIVLCNLAHNNRHLPTLLISLEQTQEEIYERLRRIHLHHHPLDSDEDFEQAYSKLMICEESRLGSEDLALLVEEYEIERGERPSVVIVDYLGYYARGMRGNSPYEKVTNGVMQLKEEAKRHRVVMIAPHQVSRMAKEGKPIGLDDARDSGVVEETADFMFSIYRPDDALREDSTAQPTGKLQLDVNKSRHGGKGRRVTLVMDLLTLAIVEALSPEAKKVDQHNFLHWRGHSYEDLRRQETAPSQQHLTIA